MHIAFSSFSLKKLFSFQTLPGIPILLVRGRREKNKSEKKKKMKNMKKKLSVRRAFVSSFCLNSRIIFFLFSRCFCSHSNYLLCTLFQFILKGMNVNAHNSNQCWVKTLPSTIGIQIRIQVFFISGWQQ